MTKKYKRMDILTALFIFVMTCVVVVILSVAQRENIDLLHENLILFIIGFYGSIICIVVRFVALYYRALKLKSLIRKIGIVIYSIVWSLLCVVMLVMVLQLTNFSVKHNVLSGYHAYQIFMLVILLAQWFGEKIFCD